MGKIVREYGVDSESLTLLETPSGGFYGRLVIVSGVERFHQIRAETAVR
jgi:hypothetical protein